jgi:hypothetical protein
MADYEDGVTFRLAPEYLKILNEEASKEGKSRHAWAKRLLIRALTDTEHTEIKSELEILRKDFKKLRGDVATLGAHLLVKVGNQKSSEAEAWVRQHLAP